VVAAEDVGISGGSLSGCGTLVCHSRRPYPSTVLTHVCRI